MLPRRLEKCARRLAPTEIDLLVAIRTEPRRGGRPGPKLGAGTQGKPPAEGKLVSVQSERYQQRANGRIRVARTVPQADAPELGEGHRRALRHARKGDRRGRGFVSHERHLPMADLGELVALCTRNLRALSDLPCGAVVGIGRHDVVGVQIEGIPLQPENPRLRRGGLPADNLRDPRARVLGVLSLLAQVGLPETVQERLREPRDKRAAGLCCRAEDRPADPGLEEILAVQFRVAKVRVRIAVRELEARQGPRQVLRKRGRSERSRTNSGIDVDSRFRRNASSSRLACDGTLSITITGIGPPSSGEAHRRSS